MSDAASVNFSSGLMEPAGLLEVDRLRAVDQDFGNGRIVEQRHDRPEEVPGRFAEDVDRSHGGLFLVNWVVCHCRLVRQCGVRCGPAVPRITKRVTSRTVSR